MKNLLIVQGIGTIGYIMLALSYLREKKHQILFMQIIAYLFFAIHFYLLDGVTGAICNLIGLFALMVIYLFDKYKLKNKKVISSFFILLILIINLITFQNIYSIFPVIALVIVIVSFLEDNENVIRFIGIISAICWLIYGIVYKSYISVIYQCVTFTVAFISLIKGRYLSKTK